MRERSFTLNGNKHTEIREEVNTLKHFFKLFFEAPRPEEGGSRETKGSANYTFWPAAAGHPGPEE